MKTTDTTARAHLQLSLRMIHSRCEDEGECRLWTGASAGAGVPYAWHDNGTRNVRRLTWELANGAQLSPGLVVAVRCGNPRCLNPAHLAPMTRAALNRKIGQAGGFSSAKARAGRVAGVRSGRAAKLDMDQAIAIRESAEHPDVLAARYGINRSQVYRIKRGQAWSATPGIVSSVFALGGAA